MLVREAADKEMKEEFLLLLLLLLFCLLGGEGGSTRGTRGTGETASVPAPALAHSSPPFVASVASQCILKNMGWETNIMKACWGLGISLINIIHSPLCSLLKETVFTLRDNLGSPHRFCMIQLIFFTIISSIGFFDLKVWKNHGKYQFKTKLCAQIPIIWPYPNGSERLESLKLRGEGQMPPPFPSQLMKYNPNAKTDGALYSQL